MANINSKKYIEMINNLNDEDLIDENKFPDIYEYFTDLYQTLFLYDKKNYLLIYFDFPESIEEIIDSNNSQWYLEFIEDKDEKIVKLSLVYELNGTLNYIIFPISLSNENKKFIKKLKKDKKITLTFFALMYGKIYKYKSHEYDLTKTFLDNLKKLKL